MYAFEKCNYCWYPSSSNFIWVRAWIGNGNWRRRPVVDMRLGLVFGITSSGFGLHWRPLWGRIGGHFVSSHGLPFSPHNVKFSLHKDIILIRTLMWLVPYHNSTTCDWWNVLDTCYYTVAQKLFINRVRSNLISMTKLKNNAWFLNFRRISSLFASKWHLSKRNGMRARPCKP